MNLNKLLACTILGTTTVTAAFAQTTDVPEDELAAAVSELSDEGREFDADKSDLSFGVGGTTFTFYGQINQGILSYDDGLETETFFPVDNDNSGSRVGIKSNTILGGGWQMDGLFEVGITPSSTSAVNILDKHDDDWSLDETDIRHLEVVFGNRQYGIFSFGQGSMATDGVTGADFSGTGVIATVTVTDLAGGQLVRDTSDALTGGTVASHFDSMDGARRFRARYDSPSINGFTFSAAYGQEVLSDTNDDEYMDVAVRYGKSYGDYEVDSGLGYSWNGSDEEVLSGSASVLHRPTGLSLSAAAGQTDDGDTSSYGYVKAGYQQDFFTVGTTAFSLDYYEGSDIYEVGADSSSVGLAVVQNFDDQNLELYGIVRDYSFAGDTTDFQDGRAVMGGIRWKF
ncbi:MAG: porin [Pseudoruegeria sp.]